MKVRNILITTFLLLITLELINADNSIKKNLAQKEKRFMGEVENGKRRADDEKENEGNNESTTIDTKEVETSTPSTNIDTTNAPSTIVEKDNKDNNGIPGEQEEENPLDNEIGSFMEYELCKEMLKPSKAFTVVLMVYMALIIVGAILVVVLLKKDLEQ